MGTEIIEKSCFKITWEAKMFKELKAGNADKGFTTILNKIVLLFVSLVVLAAATSNILAAEEVTQKDGWQFKAAPFMWVATLGGESAAGGDIDIDFSTIIDNLDMTFMGIFEAKNGKWGFLAEVIYLDLGDDDDAALGPVLTLSDVEIKSWIVTPIVTYKVMKSDQLDLDLLAGARYLYMKVGLEIDPLPKEWSSGAGWDGIVGVRGKVDLKENWYLPFHFDVGTGDTDLTWQAFGGVGYKFSKLDLIAGYRHLNYDFDDDDKGGGTFNDLNISGPILGAKFTF